MGVVSAALQIQGAADWDMGQFPYVACELDGTDNPTFCYPTRGWLYWTIWLAPLAVFLGSALRGSRRAWKELSDESKALGQVVFRRSPFLLPSIFVGVLSSYGTLWYYYRVWGWLPGNPEAGIIGSVPANPPGGVAIVRYSPAQGALSNLGTLLGNLLLIALPVIVALVAVVVCGVAIGVFAGRGLAEDHAARESLIGLGVAVAFLVALGNTLLAFL